ncbi:hypothetical protein ACFS07_31175 [Undibacterium arcticum]
MTSPSERQQQAGTALAMLLEVSRSKPGMADIDAALMSFFRPRNRMRWNSCTCCCNGSTIG